MLYSRISLLIHSKCNSLHLLTPDSQSIPLPPPLPWQLQVLFFAFLCSSLDALLHMEFPGQGSAMTPLTHCARLGIEPVTWGCRDAADPVVPLLFFWWILFECSSQLKCTARYVMKRNFSFLFRVSVSTLSTFKLHCLLLLWLLFNACTQVIRVLLQLVKL